MQKVVRFADYDWLIFLSVILIAIVGIVEIYSVTAQTDLDGHHRRQFVWVVLGLAVMVVISRVDYHKILEYIPWIYGGTILTLIGMLLFATPVQGARRWIRLEGFNFQVSEMVKLVIIVALARYFASVDTRYLNWRDLIKIGALAGLPTILVALQPDLGTALTFVIIAGAGILLAGLRFRHVIVLALAAALLMPVGYSLLKPYQQERIKTFMQPEQDVLGSGYQINQSKIAIGSGGFWGKGLRKGTQNQLGFIPSAHTDFIFAAFAEEQGFVGTVFVLLLYLVLIMRLVDGAQSAVDRAGSFLIMGFVAVLFFQIVISTAMIIGLAPVTGIPLPLMTYGGSAMMFTFIGLGLAMSVRLRRFVN